MPSLNAVTRRTVLATLLVSSVAVVHGQQTTLYDPQPPANAGYVRVLALPGLPALDVSAEGKPRIAQLAASQPSDYLVLPAGKQQLVVRGGKQTLQIPVDVAASRSITVVITSMAAKVQPQIIDDKINGNRLRAVVSAYLTTGAAPVELWTADGNTKVLGPIAPGGMAALVVNPIEFDYAVFSEGKKALLAKGHLAMTAGGAYSIVIAGSAAGPITAKAYPNTVERYTAP